MENCAYLRKNPGYAPVEHSLVSRYFGGNYVCVDGELRKNHRKKLGLVCKMRGRCSQSKLATPQ